MGLQKEMDRAVSSGIFPGGVLLAAKGEHIRTWCRAGRMGQGRFDKPVTEDTVYDLASLTKILSTTLLCMIFLEKGLIDLDLPLADFWPDRVPSDKKALTLAQLLSHESGYPAWRPFYEDWKNGPPRRDRLSAAERILSEPFEAAPHTRAIYSDLNFMLLGLILETVGGLRQDELFDRYIAAPLKIGLGYRPVDAAIPGDRAHIAPTEDVPRRGGVVWGEVHDDNARALDGVAGHAGLFGTVADAWRIFNGLRQAYREGSRGPLVHGNTVRRFWEYAPLAPGSTRGLGYDRPSGDVPSAGRLFSPKSVGHLGFTGTSLWYDPEKDFTLILFTNRVHPSAENIAIRRFRPFIHERAVEECFRD